MRLPQLGSDPRAPFPPAGMAQRSPNGLLAWGGDLSPTRLMNAYRSGIFPWYSEDDPILWWSPDPRTVFDTGRLHLSRRLRRSLRKSGWTVRADVAFAAVLDACANTPRPGQSGTWILPDMQQAYLLLHRLGFAHSIEVYEEDQLIGGVYGVDAGPVFCGESMFSRRSGASSLALAALCRQLSESGVGWLDAQMHTAHLASLGAIELRRDDYLARLSAPHAQPPASGSWSTRFGHRDARDFT